MSVENPGSLIEFASSRGLTLSQAMGGYALALEEYRFGLAENLGITVDQLHDYDFVRREQTPDSVQNTHPTDALV